MTDPAADAGTPERPRPQYGEYATPEEQRARIRQPDATWAIETGHAPDAPAAAPVRVATPAPGSTTAGRPAGRGSIVDRVVTIGLLAYGFLNVVFSVPGLLTFSSYADALGFLGVDAASFDTTSVRPWGVVAAAVMVIGWLVTAYFSVRMLTRGRLAFWVPLAGAVVTSILAAIPLMLGITADPALVEQIMGAVG